MSAGERLCIGVNQHVGFELELCTELFATNFTGNSVRIHLMSQLVVLLQSLQGGVGLVAVRDGAFEIQFSLVNGQVVFQVILVIELFATSRTEVLVASALLVNISQVPHQIVSQKEFLLANATGDVEIFLSVAMSLLHVVVKLNTTCESVNIGIERVFDKKLDLRLG